MASALNERWKELGRVIRPELEGSDSTSLIYLERPFVVPGGRFREMYYWDSYWTILGLLKSEMTDTVKGRFGLVWFIQRFICQASWQFFHKQLDRR